MGRGGSSAAARAKRGASILRAPAKGHRSMLGPGWAVLQARNRCVSKPIGSPAVTSGPEPRATACFLWEWIMTNDLFEEMADEFFQTCCPANDFRPGDAPPGAEPIGEFRIVNSREQVIAVLPFYQDPEDDRKAIFVWTEALRTEPSPTAKLEVWWRGDCILWSTVATQGGHPGADVLMCEHPREGEPLWISQMTIAVKGDLFRLGGMAVTLI